jgi:hypothetical protein
MCSCALRITTKNVPVRCYGHCKIDIAKHKASYHIMFKLADHIQRSYSHITLP